MTTTSLSPNHAVGTVLDSPAGYRIDHLETLEPFFVQLVSAGDGWGFIASTGALTAGRRSADESLFPYRTDDQLLEAASSTGSHCVIDVHAGASERTRWRPFLGEAEFGAQRAMEKTAMSDCVTLEERRDDLGLVVRVSWRFASRFGLIRSTSLRVVADRAVRLTVDDGVVNLLPPGATARVARELSNLLDAYKLTERDPASTLAWTRLNAALTDLAEPAESWRATTVWSCGGGGLRPDIRPPASTGGDAPSAPELTRGIKAAYRLRGELELEPGQQLEWHIAMDTGLDAAAVADLRHRLRTASPEDLAVELERACASDSISLASKMAAADGWQCTGDEVACLHHTSSVVFNVLRGGIPADGLTITRADLMDFLTLRHRPAQRRWADELADLPDVMAYSTLTDVIGSTRDPDLRRLLGEYLPLTFSRRHGDPSRPWNVFSIAVQDDAGSPVLRYQGNWRDIIQNWEALAVSFPPLLDPMIRVVLDAMTVDGYNPYRLSTEGVDWEVPEPEDPWSNIGYWSDHQIVYLHQLLRMRRDFLGPWQFSDLAGADYVYADVPYRLAPWRDVLRGREMVTFDPEAHDRAMIRVDRLGGDGRLRVDRTGQPIRASLIEKLLVAIAAKLVNLVPAGGIWMNTQRPEWNDANNALVGRGVSVVTAAQLRAFVHEIRDLLAPTSGDEEALEGIAVSRPLANLMERLRVILTQERRQTWDPQARARVMALLGDAAADFHSALYGAEIEERATANRDDTLAVLDLALVWLDQILAEAHESGDLPQSYGVLEGDEHALTVRWLGPMLEGQVSMLASGALDGPSAAALARSVRASGLYTADRHTYLLYPDREVAGFLERAAVPARGRDIPLLQALASRRDRRLIAVSEGEWYFGGDLRNARDVKEVLGAIATDSTLAALVHRDEQEVLTLFEEAVDHAGYTGRSGTFFAYEGLGSVYWHMVSKYLSALQVARATVPPEAEVASRLQELADDVAAGLLHRRTPAQVGAVPTDPYSHTPRGAGARQPGMTGQVKEDIVIRWRDLGLRASLGEISFAPGEVAAREWLTAETWWTYRGVDGRAHTIALPAGALAFTWCSVPIRYEHGAQSQIRITHRDRSHTTVAGWRLPRDVSEAIMNRSGEVLDVVVTVGPAGSSGHGSAVAYVT